MYRCKCRNKEVYAPRQGLMGVITSYIHILIIPALLHRCIFVSTLWHFYTSCMVLAQSEWNIYIHVYMLHEGCILWCSGSHKGLRHLYFCTRNIRDTAFQFKWRRIGNDLIFVLFFSSSLFETRKCHATPAGSLQLVGCQFIRSRSTLTTRSARD